MAMGKNFSRREADLTGPLSSVFPAACIAAGQEAQRCIFGEMQVCDPKRLVRDRMWQVRAGPASKGVTGALY